MSDPDGGEVQLADVEVLLACPGCRWTGTVQLYDIGDGPEWCCPGCDHCFPSKAVRGPDGLTNAERRLREIARQHRPGGSGEPDGNPEEVRP